MSDRCNFAQLIKVYGSSQDGEARYNPADVASVEIVPVMGQPDPKRIALCRFTRLTNAFSKKWENHWTVVATWSHIWSVREFLEAA